MAYYGTNYYGANLYSAAEVNATGVVVSFSATLAGAAVRIRNVVGAVVASFGLAGAVSNILSVAGSAISFAPALAGAAQRMRNVSGSVSMDVSLSASASNLVSASGIITIEPTVFYVPGIWDDVENTGEWTPVSDPAGPWINNSDPAGAWVNG